MLLSIIIVRLICFEIDRNNLQDDDVYGCNLNRTQLLLCYVYVFRADFKIDFSKLYSSNKLGNVIDRRRHVLSGRFSSCFDSCSRSFV